jgi:hypothetical protein
MAPAAIFGLALTTTFAAFDWLMSLLPELVLDHLRRADLRGAPWWRSCRCSCSCLRDAGLRARGHNAITTEHFHDLGKLLFGFNCFWAYVVFSQFFLIWYASIPEETVFYGLAPRCEEWLAMAYDKNEPKTALITGLSVFVVVSVVLVRYAVLSYFNIMHDQEESVKIASRGIWQLSEMRASAAQRLSGGAMPIDQAMAAVSQGQRPAAVSPRASSDTAAMTGWMQMAQPMPTEMPQNEAPPAPAAGRSGDAG